MSRIIKFRTWDGKDMSYSDDYAHLEHFFACNESSPEGVPELMQFTGLHDKNGKDIYEGDVVGFEGLGNYLVDIGGYFSNNSVGYGVCYLPNGDDSELVKDADPMGVERKGSVIGSIHENPELLES